MKQLKIPAVFMRGGTSNAIVLHARDLPRDRAQWDEIFLAAIGSPDPYGRQLDGMGGGVSSLSKVCVVGPPTRPDADIDYTFAQVQVKEAKVDYSGNCGNMSSAMGPFAVDEGLVKASGKEALVRIHNTNTKKIIHARFALDDGLSAVDGELAIPGVSGTGSPVQARIPRARAVRPPASCCRRAMSSIRSTCRASARSRASMVDAANACCFLNAADLGLTGIEMPEALDAIDGAARRSSRRSGLPRRSRWESARTPPTRRRNGSCRSSASCRRPQDAHIAIGRNDQRRQRRSDGPHDVQRPAASRAAADGVAVHGGRRAHRGQRRARGHASRHGHRSADPHRDAVGHPGGRARQCRK